VTVTDPGLEREQVAGEARHWVRISRTCNNRCSFCLDSDVQDGSFVPRDEVERELRQGIEEGATRLILSGGEASIHPDFLDLVRLGKSMGYDHVQTITNGRMFAYRDFARRAVEAGLDEVTFSLHGHTPELSDELTGVPGSFVQTVTGIRNVVSSGIVVSGDVVVSRRNVHHLRSVLDLFITLGIREFDILMVVPFGRASPDEDGGLLFDPGQELEHIHRALELSRDPSLHVWTNRLPARYLEGFETLIQDPHKLHDEVRGRRGILRDLVEGRPMRCEGDRCSHCFIHDLCREMRAAVRELEAGVPGILRVDLTGPELSRGARALLGRRRRVLWVRAARARDAADLDGRRQAQSLWLSLDDLEDPGDPPDRLIVSHGDLIERASATGAELLVAVNRSTAGRLPDGAVLAYRGCSTLREAVESDVDLREALAGTSPASCVDIPPCLSGTSSVSYEDPIDASFVGDDGLVDPDAFVTHFVQRLYRVKSLRCAGCLHDAACRGVSINLARRAGLGILDPVEG
jgi:MoaA/NifB/PqqE/SkfB family radical SAM enzyme